MPLVPMVLERMANGDRSMDLWSRLMDERIVMITSPIDDAMASIVIGQLLFLDYKDPHKDIMMYINSPGGSVTAGLGIFDTMNLVRADVSTICVGQACSMGCFLLAAGAKGKRHSTPNATIMAHQPLGGAKGQATDILIQSAEIQRLKKLLTETMADNCGMEYAKMYDLCDRDYFMTPQTALELGFIDSVIGKTTGLAAPEAPRGAMGH
jgi:ATP-dependent Clp protease protease subunit